MASTPAAVKPETNNAAPSLNEGAIRLAAASPGSGWQDSYPRDVRKALGRKRPLLNAVSFNGSERVAVGVFSIPKRKRKKFRAVTEVHYHNACNELARFLIGQLACAGDPIISKHLTCADFERDKYKFHKARIEKLKFEKLVRPEENFTIAMELQRIKKAYGTFYALCRVYNAVSGYLLYSYNPNASF